MTQIFYNLKLNYGKSVSFIYLEIKANKNSYNSVFGSSS